MSNAASPIPLVLRKAHTENEFVRSIKEISGVDIAGCLQCKKCTNGCPVGTMASVRPSEIVRRMQMNEGDSILQSDLIWMCASCETCSTRCPMKIDLRAVMDALRMIAVRKKMPAQKGNVPLFNRLFLKTVRMFGRTYDLGTIAAYKTGTSTYFQDADKIPAMLRKRKIALLPSFKADKKYIRKIFKKNV